MGTSEPPKALIRVVRETLKDYAIGAVLGIVCLWLLPNAFYFIFVNISALILLSSLLGSLITCWKPRERVESSDKAVVITGCDTGFGHMLAQRLDDLGFRVFAGCLFPDGEGAEKLKKSGSNRLHIIGLDVTKDEDVREAVNYVKSHIQDSELWAVVCNAGINDGGEMHWTNMDIFQRIMDVNTFGVVRVTKAFLTELCKSQGRLVVTASASARRTRPGITPYAMSKHAVISFCDGLRMEMYKWGVKVITVEPLRYKTPITDPEHVFNYIQKTWDKAPEEIKAIYPKNYLENFKEGRKRMLDRTRNPNIIEVVSCIEQAIMSKHPKFSYHPASLLANLKHSVYTALPRSIIDFIYCSETRNWFRK